MVGQAATVAPDAIVCGSLLKSIELMLIFEDGGMHPWKAEARPFRKPAPPAQVAGDRLAQSGLLRKGKL